ncbi:MAG: sigma-70 family RNA polymerase sigma factor [Bacteroidota bacterium]
MDISKQHFIQVVNANKGTIRSLCRLYYAEPEDQKDAHQDIILQLWKSFGSFRGEAKINTWIYRIALNTLLTKIRRDKHRIDTEPLATNPNIEVGVADSHIELLRMIIASLQPLDKAVVILHLEGYQHKEIAQIMGISDSNVSTRFNRLKSKLKSQYYHKSHASRRP